MKKYRKEEILDIIKKEVDIWKEERKSGELQFTLYFKDGGIRCSEIKTKNSL